METLDEDVALEVGDIEPVSIRRRATAKKYPGCLAPLVTKTGFSTVVMTTSELRPNLVMCSAVGLQLPQVMGWGRRHARSSKNRRYGLAWLPYLLPS